MPANINLNGTQNAITLGAPGAYANVFAPPPGPPTAAPTDILGIVGTASWGPVNSAVPLGTLAEYQAAFGNPQPRRYDAGTPLWIATFQGANAFAVVRVTDGTDVAATAMLPAGTLTARNTGSLGNQLVAVLAKGTKAATFKLTLSLPGFLSEVFDNIAGTGAAFWTNLGQAVNSGQSLSRGPSNLAVYTAGEGTTAPSAATYAFAGGTDGASAITSAALIGADGSTRTGMFALRNSGSAVAMLADCADPTTWSSQLAFALSEQLEMVDCSAPGDTVDNFAETMATAGVDSPYFKAFLGDWCFFTDTINNVPNRMVSPQAFYAGEKVANGAQNSALNAPLNGIVATQSTMNNLVYSADDLTNLQAARGDVISIQSPGGNYYSCIIGVNTSSNEVECDDSFTTMTNFLALTLSGPTGGGRWVGQLDTPTEERQAASSFKALLQNMVSAGQIQAFSVSISTNTNGVQTATVAVQYLTVIRWFVVNLTGGATVQIATSQSAASTAAAQATA